LAAVGASAHCGGQNAWDVSEMHTTTTNRRKPNITIGKTDYERLTNLAVAAAERLPQESEALLLELERGHVIADGPAGEYAVQMGSTARYRMDTGDTRTITLVFPGDADISEGKVSVLTPIGTALLGLSAGQSMTWTARDGCDHELTVLSVTQAPRAFLARRASDLHYPTADGAQMMLAIQTVFRPLTYMDRLIAGV
jgi:regulator of nucleoside diphosphate kinase